MRWSNAPGAGFTEAGVRPWLPLGDSTARNVADQQRDPQSTLSFVRDLIAVRRQCPDLRSGTYRQLPSPADAWVWQRGPDTTIALNLSDKPVQIPAIRGTVVIRTTRSRDGERLEGGLSLGPWEGAICSSAST